MAETSREILRCEALVVGYRRVPLVPAIDLTIDRQQFWAVVGRNGSGKTTWMQTVLGLLPGLSGSVRLRPDTRVSYLPQRAQLDDLYPLSARDVVALGALRDWSFAGAARGSAQVAAEALRAVGAERLASRSFRELSEGQKQRVLFARLVAARADIAFLDEPTSAMDREAELESFELLDGLRRDHGMAIVIVSHYVGLAARFADHALVLDRERGQVQVGPASTVLGGAAEHADA